MIMQELYQSYRWWDRVGDRPRKVSDTEPQAFYQAIKYLQFHSTTRPILLTFYQHLYRLWNISNSKVPDQEFSTCTQLPDTNGSYSWIAGREREA